VGSGEEDTHHSFGKKIAAKHVPGKTPVAMAFHAGKLDRSLPNFILQGRFISLRVIFDIAFQKRDIPIHFDRTTFFAYKFGVDLFAHETVSRR
jgi:hypothetical protein